MFAQIDNCMYLNSNSGEFTNNEGETIKYSRAEFYQKDGGSSVSFTVAKDVDLSRLETFSFYNLTVDLAQVSSGNSRGFRARVIDVQEVYGG